MDRPRSTTKSLHSCSPSSVPTPLSITATQGIRRSHLTPTSALVDGELSLSKMERLSPHQRKPTSGMAETGTPRLAAAVSEAKRSADLAPSPSCTDAEMDHFDRLLMRNVKLSNTPSQTPLSAREDTSSPNMVSRAVHNVVADEFKRRELLLGLQRLLHEAKVIPHPRATSSRNNTPSNSHSHNSLSAPHQEGNVVSSISALARIVRDVSPLQPPSYITPSLSTENRIDNDRDYHIDHLASLQQPVRNICRPRPTAKSKTMTRTLAESLAMREVPSSQKIIKSELSAFSETTESSSLTSYSTTKSAKPSNVKVARDAPHF